MTILQRAYANARGGFVVGALAAAVGACGAPAGATINVAGAYSVMGTARAQHAPASEEVATGMGVAQVTTGAGTTVSLNLTVTAMGLNCTLTGARDGGSVAFASGQTCAVPGRSAVTFTLAAGSASFTDSTISVSLNGSFTRADGGDMGDWLLTATGSRSGG